MSDRSYYSMNAARTTLAAFFVFTHIILIALIVALV